MKALIVEDEIFSANRLKSIVTRCGIEVIGIVDNAKDALRVCRKERPELVLMDIMIKGATSGLEVAIEIKYTISNKITIIFLSAYSDREMIDYALDANTFAYLLKPYREGEIEATLELCKAQVGDNKKSVNSNNHIEFQGGYSFDMDNSKLYLYSDEIPIGNKGKKLLEILCKNKHIFVSSTECIKYVWGDTESGSVQALRSLIYRLKNSVKVPLIESKTGVGYKVLTKQA